MIIFFHRNTPHHYKYNCIIFVIIRTSCNSSCFAYAGSSGRLGWRNYEFGCITFDFNMLKSISSRIETTCIWSKFIDSCNIFFVIRLYTWISKFVSLRIMCMSAIPTVTLFRMFIFLVNRKW